MWRDALVLALVLFAHDAGAIEKEDLRPRRLSHLLGYIAADYANAVADGKIVDRFEYEEQLSLLDTCTQLATEIGMADIADGARGLRAAVEGKDPVPGVVADARALRRRVIGKARLVVVPEAPPNLERGRALFQEHCAKCHGAGGRAETLEAARLKPAPVSFTDPTVVEALSPLRVADTLRFGIDGTAMVPFDFLSGAERWDLAFYVVTLRHTPRVSPHTPRLSLAELAILTDAEILDELYEAGASARELLTFAAELRVRPHAPARGRMRDMVSARAKIIEADQLIARGDREAALEVATAAHSADLRPALPIVATLDAALAGELDERLLLWRTRIPNDDEDDLHRDVRVLTRLMTRAQLAVARFGVPPRLATEGGSHGVPLDEPTRPSLARATQLLFGGGLRLLLWPSLCWLIAFAWASAKVRRNAMVAGAMSAAIGALIGGTSASATTAVTVISGALLLAIVTAALAAERHRERAIIAICVGAGFIWGMVVTTIGQSGAMRTSALAALLGLGGAALLLAFLAFEGAQLARRGDRRLIQGASALVAAALVGQGVMALQTAGIVPAHGLGFVGAPSLGVHPTIETCATQIMVAALGVWRVRAGGAKTAHA